MNNTIKYIFGLVFIFFMMSFALSLTFVKAVMYTKYNETTCYANKIDVDKYVTIDWTIYRDGYDPVNVVRKYINLDVDVNINYTCFTTICLWNNESLICKNDNNIFSSYNVIVSKNHPYGNVEILVLGIITTLMYIVFIISIYIFIIERNRHRRYSSI
jgi:hypothetical protein